LARSEHDVVLNSCVIADRATRIASPSRMPKSWLRVDRYDGCGMVGRGL
jgi:hypothetical protein